MNILFVCKYNRFRSRVAEAYFKKLNKNKNIHVFSGGILQGHYPLDKGEVKIAKSNGVNIQGKPKTITTDLLRKTDLVVIVANNVPRSIFNYEGYTGKIIVWKIRDVFSDSSKALIEKRIKKIKKKIEKLVVKLENSK